MKIIRMCALIAYCIMCTNVSYGMTSTVDVPRTSPNLPLTEVSTNNGSISWSMYGSKSNNRVLMRNLDLFDALALKAIAIQAQGVYLEMIKMGGCPSSELSQTIRALPNTIASTDRISFTVVCKNNNIMVSTFMSDAHIVNTVVNSVSVSDLLALAESVISHFDYTTVQSAVPGLQAIVISQKTWKLYYPGVASRTLSIRDAAVFFNMANIAKLQFTADARKKSCAKLLRSRKAKELHTFALLYNMSFICIGEEVRVIYPRRGNANQESLSLPQLYQFAFGIMGRFPLEEIQKLQ